MSFVMMSEDGVTTQSTFLRVDSSNRLILWIHSASAASWKRDVFFSTTLNANSANSCYEKEKSSPYTRFFLHVSYVKTREMYSMQKESTHKMSVYLPLILLNYVDEYG
jgi:hypothetical protein